MIPSDLEPADHIFPEVILYCASQREDLVVAASVAADRDRSEQVSVGPDIFGASVQTEFFAGLEGDVTGQGIGVVIGAGPRAGCAQVSIRTAHLDGFDRGVERDASVIGDLVPIGVLVITTEEPAVESGSREESPV